MNCVISINLSLKYQNFTQSGCKEIGIQKFEIVAKTQFLSTITVVILGFYCSFSHVIEKKQDTFTKGWINPLKNHNENLLLLPSLMYGRNLKNQTENVL